MSVATVEHNTLADALARPRQVEFAGKTREIRVLNFNDLADLELQFGDIENIDTGKISVQRYLIWFILSRNDKSLTEQVVGENLTLDKGPEVGRFIQQIFALSGFRQADENSYHTEGSDSPNAPEPEAETSASGSSTSSPSSSSAAASRRKSPAK